MYKLVRQRVVCVLVLSFTFRYTYELQEVTQRHMSVKQKKVRLDEHDPEIELTPGTTKSDIVALLYRHQEFGYTPQAVHEELGIPYNTAKGTLRRLLENDYIDQTEDGYYHAIESREALFRYVGALDGLDRMFQEHDETDEEPTISTPVITEEEPEGTSAEIPESDSELSEDDLDDVASVIDENVGE